MDKQARKQKSGYWRMHFSRTKSTVRRLKSAEAVFSTG